MNTFIFLIGVGLSIWGAVAELPIIFAISLICVSGAIVRANVFDLEWDDDALELNRGKAFFAFLVFAALVIWGLSSSLYTSEEYAYPEPLNPPENLRIGDTSYFERSYSIDEIEQAISVANGLSPEIVANTEQAVTFTLTLLIIYFGLLAFNKQWNHQKAWSLFLISGFLGGGIYFSSMGDGYAKYGSSVPEEIQRVLYPAQVSDCKFTKVTEVDAGVERENKVDSYTVDTPIGSTNFSVTSDEKEWNYKAGYTRRTQLTNTLFLNGICDEPVLEGWSRPCAGFSKCVSAVAHIETGKKEPYKLLENVEIKKFLEE